MIYAQFARHGEALWDKSDSAYDSISSLTQIYNAMNHGKWNYMMDFKPRNLPVFDKVKRVSLTMPMKTEQNDMIHKWNALGCSAGSFIPCEGLGYEGKAVNILKGKGISFDFPEINADSIEVELYFYPLIQWKGSIYVLLLLWTEKKHLLCIMRPRDVVRNGKKMYCVIRHTERLFYLWYQGASNIVWR